MLLYILNLYLFHLILNPTLHNPNLLFQLDILHLYYINLSLVIFLSLYHLQLSHSLNHYNFSLPDILHNFYMLIYPPPRISIAIPRVRRVFLIFLSFLNFSSFIILSSYYLFYYNLYYF